MAWSNSAAAIACASAAASRVVGHHHLRGGAVVQQRQAASDPCGVPRARLARQIRQTLGEPLLVLRRQPMCRMVDVWQFDGGVEERAAPNRVLVVGQRREQLQQPGSRSEVRAPQSPLGPVLGVVLE